VVVQIPHRPASSITCRHPPHQIPQEGIEMVIGADDLVHRPSVIVGGASGIGLAVARQAVEQAKSVAVIDLSAEVPDVVAALPGVDYRQANVLDPVGLSNAFASI
jgi:hypothetical protein